MTNRLTFILLFFTLLFNCSINEQPDFIGLENIKVLDSNIKNITISADAHFTNPNDLGGRLKTDNLKVYINDSEVAKFVSEEFEVPKKKDFKIPLTVSIATDSIIDKKSIGGLIGSLISQNLEVQYKGEIKYKVLGYYSTYDVNETQNIKIKL